MDFLLLDLETINQAVAAWSPRIVGSIAILAGFYVLGRFICFFLRKAMQRLSSDASLINLFVRSTRIVVSIIAIVTALGTLGVDVSALVAGLGLTGFALGFALKDTISNLLSGVLILLHKPFVIGDTITIAGFSGRVMQIDLRYTQLESEGKRIYIPNAKLFTDPLTVEAVTPTSEATE